jgi:dihydroflavonol-4-reductase
MLDCELSPEFSGMRNVEISEVGSMNTIYLVTGASGHVGSTVVQQLTALGHTVRVLVLPTERHIPEKAEVFYGDVRDKESLRSCFEHNSRERFIVIHCAGIVSIASRYHPILHDVNVTGTQNIVDLCCEYDVSKLVYVSSVHAIPEKPEGQLITETNEFSPGLVTGHYAKTKAEATAYVLAAAQKGLNASIVHPSGIIGPNDHLVGHITSFIIDYCQGRLLACVDGGYDFVDVRDVADGIISACDGGGIGECYILSNRYYKVGEILDMLHDITGIRKIGKFVPAWMANAAAPLTEFYCKISKKPPLFTSYSIYTLQTNAHFSHQKATDQLGYQPREMKETLVDTVAWLKETGRL